jgi:hypothetical protein
MSFLRAGDISINLFKRLQDLGFSEIENFLELIDNSIDFKAKNISIIIETKNGIQYLYFVDDGLGMDGKGQVKYYNLAGDKPQELNENHIGSKGMGGKIAAINLSNRGNVDIISRTSPENWAESSYDWQSPEYVGSVMVSTKKSMDADQIVSHIFQDMLQTETPYSFTIISMKLDKTIYDTLFQSSTIDAKKSLAFNLGITYDTHLNDGIKITIIHDGTTQAVVPISISISKKPETFYPEKIDKVIEPKHKSQKEGGPNLIKYIGDISLYYERNFILYKDGSVVEIDDEQNDYLFDGVLGINQHINGRYKEKKKIDKNAVLSEELIRFTIKHTFYANITELKDNIRSEFLSNNHLDETTVQEIFYGCHFVRNDKTIIDAAVEYKDIKSGDFHKRLMNRSQFLLKFKVGPHDHGIDNCFGIMVNKSRLNKSSIHSSILKLISYLYHENQHLLITTVDAKIEEFNIRYPQIEPNPLQAQPTPLPTQSKPLPTQSKPLQAQPTPLPIQSKPLPTQCKPLQAQPTPLPTQSKPLPTQSKPLPTQSKPLPTVPIQEDLEDGDNTEDVAGINDDQMDEDQTDDDVTDTDEEEEIENNDNKKKPRKKLSKNFRTRIVELQGTKEKITGVEFCSFIRSEIDHIDGNPGNDADENLQAISPNLHSVKTNDPATYAEIEKKPHIYNIKVALAHLDSPVTLSNLSIAEQTKLLQFRKFLKTLINL